MRLYDVFGHVHFNYKYVCIGHVHVNYKYVLYIIALYTKTHEHIHTLTRTHTHTQFVCVCVCVCVCVLHKFLTYMHGNSLTLANQIDVAGKIQHETQRAAP